MRFEVPQFIEVEDKIFGPLTWRQFVYLGGGVGWAIVCFLFLPSFILFIIFGLPVLIFSLALAFYPINNRPFSSFVESIFNYIMGQRQYLWRQKNQAVYKGRDDLNGSEDRPLVAPVRRKSNAKDISSLARKLELQALQKAE